MKLSKKTFREYRSFLAVENPTCQICKNDVSADLHHLFFGNFGADKDDRYLIAVCRRCHEWCHRNKKQSQLEYKDLAVKNWRKFNENT